MDCLIQFGLVDGSKGFAGGGPPVSRQVVADYVAAVLLAYLGDSASSDNVCTHDSSYSMWATGVRTVHSLSGVGFPNLAGTTRPMTLVASARQLLNNNLGVHMLGPAKLSH